MQARYTPNHDKMCPSCGVCVEDCQHVLMCEEVGRVELLNQSIDLVDTWLLEHGTEEKLRKYLVRYAKGRGGRMMLELVSERAGPY
jgi:hypothetical protein